MKKWRIIVAALLLIAVIGGMTTSVFAKYDLTTDEIKVIQKKLKAWGYYTGQVDGIYGSLTTQAVRYFQRKNGLTEDGIVGPKTAAKLGMQLGSGGSSGSGSSSGNKGSSDSNIYLLARVVYGEARGEPYKGKVAVAAVVLNRVDDPGFPNTISGVVYQPGAFSIVADGQINLSPDEEALRAARDAMNGVDPTGGCTFYYNPKKTSNKYMHSKPVVIVIGNHSFCK